MSIKETPEDKNRQAAVAAAVAKQWEIELRSTGEYETYDYALSDPRSGEFLGVAEVKVRTHVADGSTTFFASLRKWSALRLISIEFGVPALWIIGFRDSIKWFSIDDIRGRGVMVKVGGRTDRKFSTDQECMVCVPNSVMTSLAGSQWPRTPLRPKTINPVTDAKSEAF